MDEFVDKVVLITGAGRGVGREIALAFSSLGAVVAANDINPINLDVTVGQILESRGSARAYVFDIAKRMPIEAMVMQVLDHYGHIDILVNQASVEPDASLLEMDEWEFHRTLDVNLGGPFFTMQQVGRVMQRQGGGAIVNLISTVGQDRIQKGNAAHLASQVGLVGLTHAAAREFASHNIRVNAVCYGAFERDLVALYAWDMVNLHHWLESFPQVRLGDHSDLVGLVMYMCSQAAASLTGQISSIDLEKSRPWMTKTD
jgi:NAD(P)-dependent dehydrogenase (short-subunit alcohol dehydrogenase family)